VFVWTDVLIYKKMNLNWIIKLVKKILLMKHRETDKT